MSKTITLSEPLGMITKIVLRGPRYADLIVLDMPATWVELPGGGGFLQVTPAVLAAWIERLADIDPDYLPLLCLRDALAVRCAVLQFFIEASTPGGAYIGIGGMFFDHDTVNHGEGEFVRDAVTTNGIESVFAVRKRGLIGVYHHASKKHLDRYVDEFTFRLNEGNVTRHTLDRLDSLVCAVAGKRLTYKTLIQ
jgi:hypothetical protein